jgi:hypothetical protein
MIQPSPNAALENWKVIAQEVIGSVRHLCCRSPSQSQS